MKIRISTVAVALMFTACGGDSSTPSPLTPTSPTSPAPPSSSATTRWIVMHRFASVEGPDNCWVRQQRASLTGVGFRDMPMTITRSNGSITIESEWFQTYRGTYSGNQFSASGTRPLEGGGRPCQDGTLFQQGPGVSNLSGSFSPDDKQLTANEVNTYALISTGEPVIYTWAWEATR